MAESSLFYDFSSSFGYRTVVHLLGFNKNTVQRNFQFAELAPRAARRQALARLLPGCRAAAYREFEERIGTIERGRGSKDG